MAISTLTAAIAVELQQEFSMLKNLIREFEARPLSSFGSLFGIASFAYAFFFPYETISTIKFEVSSAKYVVILGSIGIGFLFAKVFIVLFDLNKNPVLSIALTLVNYILIAFILVDFHQGLGLSKALSSESAEAKRFVAASVLGILIGPCAYAGTLVSYGYKIRQQFYNESGWVMLPACLGVFFCFRFSIELLKT